ncbi:unnamed protein product [Soboliphyme baturini]|uniref:Uncharacterized protein n=1 Tax=Soboliphyme baturini TaxID=241478 RepID=A0A183IHZ0_9BILA|nr:unnamed protein product [Soboliphyme baturini]
MDKRIWNDDPQTRGTEVKEESNIRSFVGGRETQEYDNYVRNLFSPGHSAPGYKKTFNDRFSSYEQEISGLPQHLQLKAENVADSLFERQRNERLAKVPHSSSKVFDNRNPLYYRSADFLGTGDWDDALFDYDKKKRDRERKTPLIMRYTSSSNAIGSSYAKPVYDHLHMNDSRIVGSDFVMLNLRRYDSLFEKIDKALDDAKKVNSWS